MFALLALVCFPVVALADSSGIQYSDAPPTVPGGQSAGSSGAGGVDSGDQSSTSSGSTSSGESTNDGQSSDDDDKSGAAGKDSGDKGQGSQGGGAANKAGVGGGQPLGSAEAEPISHGGGSSPLVPILIALAVLAAISAGVMVMRRRGQGRSGGGAKSRVSPEAG